MNQKHRPASSSHQTLWKLKPLLNRGRKTGIAGNHVSAQECAEAEYFASISVWGGLNHRLSEFLDSAES